MLSVYRFAFIKSASSMWATKEINDDFDREDIVRTTVCPEVNLKYNSVCVLGKRACAVFDVPGHCRPHVVWRNISCEFSPNFYEADPCLVPVPVHQDDAASFGEDRES